MFGWLMNKQVILALDGTFKNAPAFCYMLTDILVTYRSGFISPSKTPHP